MPRGGRNNIFMCRRCGKETNAPICPECMRAKPKDPDQDQEGIPLPQEGQLEGVIIKGPTAKQTKAQMEALQKARTQYIQNRDRPKPKKRTKRKKPKKKKGGKKKRATPKKSTKKKGKGKTKKKK